MNLNIKGIIHLDFRKFKSYEELLDYINREDNLDTLGNIFFTKNREVSYKASFNDFDEVWVIENYLVAKREKGSDEVEINPDFTRFLIEESFNHVEETKKIEESKDFAESLSVDSILDKISKVGIENISESERKFLDNNG